MSVARVSSDITARRKGADSRNPRTAEKAQDQKTPRAAAREGFLVSSAMWAVRPEGQLHHPHFRDSNDSPAASNPVKT